MRTPTEWVDHLELCAISQIYACSVEVYEECPFDGAKLRKTYLDEVRIGRVLNFGYLLRCHNIPLFKPGAAPLLDEPLGAKAMATAKRWTPRWRPRWPLVRMIKGPVAQASRNRAGQRSTRGLESAWDSSSDKAEFDRPPGGSPI